MFFLPQVMSKLRSYVDELNAAGGEGALEGLPTQGPCSKWVGWGQGEGN